MIQLPLFQTPSYWTITELTHYLRDLMESDYNLQELWVQGEVSNLSRPGSGHVYFTLKDASCSLKCVMWRTQAVRQAYLPRNGDQIEAHGSINIYEVTGQYQLYADQIRPSGEGELFREFLRLKSSLEAEGLFAPERKRPIPRWPVCIGIITSPTGAAIRDMINTLRRRFPPVRVVLASTAVQGDEAPDGIVRALRALCRLSPCPDVILVARGGGSIEDLWAFNEEQVARAIAASPIPVISGVGHETDFTIADFVCDLRAPTPTAAAELATPNRADLLDSLYDFNQRMGRAIQTALSNQRWELGRLENRLAIRSPQTRVHSDRQRLDDLSYRAGLALERSLQLERAHLDGLAQRLAALSPLAVMSRGYALVTQPDGTRLRSVTETRTGAPLQIHLHDGRLDVQVKDVQPTRGSNGSRSEP